MGRQEGNHSNGSVLDETGQQVTSAAFRAIGISMIILFCLALAENIMVLLVYRRTRKLHSKTNIWIVSLVICDLLIVINAFPFVIVSSFAEEYVFGTTGCKWDGFIITLLGTTSIFLLTGLSIHRYIIIFSSHKHRRIGKSNLLSAILICFLFGLFWAIVPLVGWGSYALEGVRISCAPDWRSQTVSNQSYTLCLFTFVLFIPCVLLAFCYMRIICKVWHERKIQSNWIRQRRVKRDIKVTISAALMIGSFLLAWTPYAVVSLCEAFFDIDVYSISWLLVQLPCLMAKTACMWNPLVLICRNSDFKKALLELFKSVKNTCFCNFRNTNGVAKDSVELRVLENGSTSTT